MVAKLYFRKNGAAATTFTDVSNRIAYFDDKTPVIQMGGAFQNGSASQGSFMATTHSSTTETYAIVPHMLVRWTEDAPGCEYWLAQGRVSSSDVGRGALHASDNVERWSTVDDCNVDTRGLAFTEDWVRPAETDYARLVVLQAYTLNGTSSTRPSSGGVITYRPSTTITVLSSHLAPNTNTVSMPAKTYPAGTQPQDVIDDCVSSAGKVAGVVIHHNGPGGGTGVIRHWNMDNLVGAGPEYTAYDVETGTLILGTTAVYGHYVPADTAFGANGSPPNGYAWIRSGHTDTVPGLVAGSNYTLEMDILWELDPSVRKPSWQWMDSGGFVISSIALTTGSESINVKYHVSQTLTAPAGTVGGRFGWSSADFHYVDNLTVSGPGGGSSTDCSHLCLEYIREDNHTTYASSLKISDHLADINETSISVPVLPPIWDQGRGRAIDGQAFISGLVTHWGPDNVPFIFSASVGIGDANEYWYDAFSDSDSVTQAQASARAFAILGYRSQYDETNRVSIILNPNQTNLITAGMSIQIKSAVTSDSPANSNVYLTRRIVQLQWEPISDGRYFAHMQLNRGLRRGPASSGDLAAASSVPTAPTTSTAVPDYTASGSVGTSRTYLPADSTLPMPPSTDKQLTNKSGGAVVPGDVVIQDTANDKAFTTNATLNYSGGWVGIALEAIQNNATGKVLLSGYGSNINVGSNSTTRGTYLYGSNMARRAYGSNARTAGAFGQVLSTSTNPDAILWGTADQIATGGGSGGGGASTSDHFIVGQGGESDTDLSAKVVIPGLSGSPDIRVAGTNDNEFDSTDTGNPPTSWTAIGTLNAVDINSTFKSHLYLKANAAAGVSLKGIYKSSPGQPFTLTAKLTDAISAGNYNRAGIFVGEATPGISVILSSVFSTDPWRIAVDKYSSPTVSAGNVAAVGAETARPPVYLRIVVTSNTSVAFYYSATGFVWTLLTSAYNPGMTIASYGLVVNSENATYAEEAVFDWIRLT